MLWERFLEGVRTLNRSNPALVDIAGLAAGTTVVPVAANELVVVADGSPTMLLELHSSCEHIERVNAPRTWTAFPGMRPARGSTAAWPSGWGPASTDIFSYWRPFFDAAVRATPHAPDDAFESCEMLFALRRMSYEQPRGCFNWNAAGQVASGNTRSSFLASSTRDSRRVDLGSGVRIVPRHAIGVYESYATSDAGAIAFAARWVYWWYSTRVRDAAPPATGAAITRLTVAPRLAAMFTVWSGRTYRPSDRAILGLVEECADSGR